MLSPAKWRTSVARSRLATTGGIRIVSYCVSFHRYDGVVRASAACTALQQLAASSLAFFRRSLAAALKEAVLSHSWRVFMGWYARARRKFTCTRLLPVMLVCYMSLAITASLKKGSRCSGIATLRVHHIHTQRYLLRCTPSLRIGCTPSLPT